MDMALKAKFVESWNKYFNSAELPISFYTDRNDAAERVATPAAHMCMLGVLARVRKGASLCFDVNSIACGGGKRCTGFTEEISPTFEYFLSCGIPGKFEGERYKKSPGLVREMMAIVPQFRAPARNIVFKRFDMLEQSATQVTEKTLFIRLKLQKNRWKQVKK
jgi:hypothetical protein